MTKREGISQVKGLFRQVNTDARLTNKLVWSLIEKHSLWIIKRDSEQLKLIKKGNLFQTRKCLKVIPVSATDDCCGINLPNCIIYRTEVQLPKMYEDLAGPIIKRVVSLDGSTTVKIYSPAAYQSLKKNPFASNKEIRGWLGNRYIYFPDKHIKALNVEAMFMDKVNNDKNCSPCADCDENGNCEKFLDTAWVIPDYLEAQVIDSVIKELGNTYARIPEKAHTPNKNDNT